MDLKSEAKSGVIVGAVAASLVVVGLIGWMALGKHGGGPAVKATSGPMHPPVPSPGAPGSPMAGAPGGVRASYGSPNSGGHAPAGTP